MQIKINGTACTYCLMFLLFAGHLQAQTTLLRNPDFIVDDGKPATVTEWEIEASAGWKRHEIPAFKALTSNIYAIEGLDNAIISQRNIPTKPETWYRMSTWYRASLSPAKRPNFLLSLSPSDAKLNDYESLSSHRFGSIRDWVQVQAFFYSGENKSIQLNLRFSGKGSWAIGNCSLREIKDEDFAGAYAADGDFGEGIVGYIPTDLTGINSQGNSQPKIVTTTDLPPGQQSVKIELKSQQPLTLSGHNSMLARPGSKIKIHFLAKASMPGFKLLAQLNRLPKDNNGASGWRREKGLLLDSNWQKIALEVTVPESGKYYLNGPQILSWQIKGIGDNDCSVLIDDLAVTVEPLSKEPDFKIISADKPKKNLVLMNSSFEAGLSGWDFRFTGNIQNDGPPHLPGKASIDTTTAGEGTCSLRLEVPEGIDLQDEKYQVNSKVNYGGFLFSAYFPATAQKPYTVSFWAKAEKPAPVIFYMPYRQGKKGVVKISPKWKRYSVTLIPAEDIEGYMSLKFGFPSPGTYWIDGVQVEEGNTVSDYEPPGMLEVGGAMRRLYPCYINGDKPQADVYLCSRLSQTTDLEFSYTVLDWQGKTVNRSSRIVTIPPGQTLLDNIVLPANLNGAFQVHFNLRNPATSETASSPLIYGVFPEPRDLPDASKSWVGVMAHCFFSDYQRNAIDLPRAKVSLKGGSVDDMAQLLRLMGIRWNRAIRFGSWDGHEPLPNKWQWVDPYVDAMNRNGIMLMPVLGPHFRAMPPWAQSEHGRKDTKKFIAALGETKNYPKIEHWKNYVGKFVKHYGDRLGAVEILNETGGCEPAAYLALAKAAYEGAKEANADLPVVAPAYPNQQMPYGPNDNSWIGQVMKLGMYQYIDVYSGHFYPPDYDLEDHVDLDGSLEDSLQQKMRYFRTAYGKKPVWDTESGMFQATNIRWLNDPSAQRESLNRYGKPFEENARIAAAEWVRWAVMKRAAGIDKIFAFILNYAPLSAETHRDLLEHNMAPKPVAVAYSQVGRRLELSDFKTKINIGRNNRIYIFEVENRPLAIYWNHAAKSSGAISIPLNSHSIQVEDLMGNPVAAQEKGNSSLLPLSLYPIYVLSDKLSTQEMISAFRNAEVSGLTTEKLTPVD